MRSQPFPYRFEILTPSQLTIDESYQRPLSHFVEAIVEDFDPALLQTLAVAERKNTYAVIDGQTRLAALRRLGALQVPCLIYNGLSRAQEALLFARFQTERRGIRPYHRFRAQLRGGDPEAQAISRILDGTGWTLSEFTSPRTSGVIGCVGALEVTYRADPELLERSLLIMRSAYPEHPGSAELLRGLSYFLVHAEEVDDDALVRKLASVSPTELARRASALREGRGHGGASPRYMAEAISAVYQRRGLAMAA
jgi:hypothetical protein